MLCLQENRSFDHYFGTLCSPNPSCRYRGSRSPSWHLLG
ncbi:hypothetical protein [Mycobacterium tuberculosis]